jgi:hypothetical protein
METMTSTIFHTENNSAEEWLIVNDDGTVTHHIENTGWPMAHSGLQPRENIITAQAAKLRWPSYAMDIDSALVKLDAEK